VVTNGSIFFKVRIQDTAKQYLIKYILRLLVELNFIGRSILIFYNENVILHELLIKLLTTNMIMNINYVKIILLLLILI
jgi:hypothetical protein